MAVAQHVREVPDKGAGSGEFLAAAGDLGQCCAAVVGELARRDEDPACHLWRGAVLVPGDGGVLAQPGGEPAQGAQASPVAAAAEFLVQLLGAAAAFVPSLAQAGQVRIEEPAG